MKYLILFVFCLISTIRLEAKLFPVLDGDYVSYIDSTGAIIISGEFYPYFNKAKMNVNGKELADIVFEKSAYFSDGLAFVREPYRLFGLFSIWNEYKYINVYGEEVLSVTRPGYSAFSNSYAKFVLQTTPSQYGLIDKYGQRVSAMQRMKTDTGRVTVYYDRFFYISDFYEGKAIVLLADSKDEPYTYLSNDLWLSTKTFEEADIYSEGLAGVKIKGKWGYMNHDYDIEIRPQFDFATPFNEGYAKVMSDKYFGFIDKKGDYIIEPKYVKTGLLREGVVPAMIGEKWGLLDKDGNWLIQPEYYYLSNSYNGLIAFEKDGKYGFIDRNNKVVIYPEYDFVEDFDAGLAKVWADGELFYIDTKGDRIWTILDKSEHNSVLQDLNRNQ